MFGSRMSPTTTSFVAIWAPSATVNPPMHFDAAPTNMLSSIVGEGDVTTHRPKLAPFEYRGGTPHLDVRVDKSRATSPEQKTLGNTLTKIEGPSFSERKSTNFILAEKQTALMRASSACRNSSTTQTCAGVIHHFRISLPARCRHLHI